jgi:hypothetical protein
VGYSFTNPQTLTVSADATSMIYGMAHSISLPDAPDVCRVYEWCFDQAGLNPLASVNATAKLTAPYTGTRSHTTAKIDGTYDPATGLLYWDIVRGASVEVVIAEIGLKKGFIVPDSPSARLAEMA